MTDRPTDEQVAELLSATLYSYQAGEYPEGMTVWVDAFTDGAGGLVNAITEWQAERARTAAVLELCDDSPFGEVLARDIRRALTGESMADEDG